MPFPLFAAMKFPSPPSPFQVVRAEEGHYPDGLRRLGAPPVIYVRGHWDWPWSATLAVVGTRKPTHEGVAEARRWVLACKPLGWGIVSGLARGIDAAAHAMALECDLPTAGVLGCGPDRIYPQTHAALAQAMLKKGAVLSEYPPGTPPLRNHFPRRNRIIAALARAVVVVEAGLGSGALYTAVFARKMGIPVLVPLGLAQGPEGLGLQELLRQGALGFRSAEEGLEYLRGMHSGEMGTSRLGKPERGSQIVDQTLSQPGKLAAAVNSREAPRASRGSASEKAKSASLSAQNGLPNAGECGGERNMPEMQGAKTALFHGGESGRGEAEPRKLQGYGNRSGTSLSCTPGCSPFGGNRNILSRDEILEAIKQGAKSREERVASGTPARKVAAGVGEGNSERRGHEDLFNEAGSSQVIHEPLSEPISEPLSGPLQILRWEMDGSLRRRPDGRYEWTGPHS